MDHLPKIERGTDGTDGTGSTGSSNGVKPPPVSIGERLETLTDVLATTNRGILHVHRIVSTIELLAWFGLILAGACVVTPYILKVRAK